MKNLPKLNLKHKIYHWKFWMWCKTDVCAGWTSTPIDSIVSYSLVLDFLDSLENGFAMVQIEVSRYFYIRTIRDECIEI